MLNDWIHPYSYDIMKIENFGIKTCMQIGGKHMKSMTGYGKYSIKNDYGELTIEIKSVNNRFLDINTHMPKSMTLNEDQIRKCIQNFIERGTVDVYFSFSLNSDVPKPIELDLSAVSAYLSASRTLKEKFGLTDDFTTSIMLKFPMF